MSALLKKALLMKYIYVILISLLFQSTVWAEWGLLPLKDTVKESDLVVIGTLTGIKEYTENKMDYGSGTITVEEVLYGKLPAKEKKITLIWQNRSGLACPRVEHRHQKDKKGICSSRM